MRESGVLLVRVSGRDVAGTTWPLPYRFAAEMEPGEMFEVEPNSTIETATPLALGAAISGHIFPVDDVDTYRIDIAGVEGDSTPVGKLSIDLDAGYGARLTLKLWDSAGYEISQVASKQIARPLHMAFDAPAGAYYLSVTGSGDNCGKPYTIRTGFDAKPGVAVPAPSAPNGDLGVQPAVQTPPSAPNGGEGTGAAPNAAVDADLAQILEAAAAVKEQKANEGQAAESVPPAADNVPQVDEDAF